MCRRFGLEYNLVSSRNGKKKSWNRVSRKISFVDASIRKREHLLRAEVVSVSVLKM